MLNTALWNNCGAFFSMPCTIFEIVMIVCTLPYTPAQNKILIKTAIDCSVPVYSCVSDLQADRPLLTDCKVGYVQIHVNR